MNMKRFLLPRLIALTACLWCALGVAAAEAYAEYNSSNTTLTFYYDNQRSTRTGTTYDVSADAWPAWCENDGPYAEITKVVFKSSFAGARPTSTAYWFFDMANLQFISGLNYLNTSRVTSMSCMFDNCESLTNLDMSNFITSNVTSMSYMFRGCAQLTSLDLSSFNTANVTNMSNMFRDCTSLKSLDVSGFNTANVTNMESMFYNCSAMTNLDLSSFNTTNVTDMSAMFNNCKALTSLDLSSFVTSKVTNLSLMFSACTALTSLDVSNFYTSKVTTMNRMFESCKALTRLDLSSFNTAKVTNMARMFYDCSNLKSVNVGDGWSTTIVSSSTDMFKNCSSIVGGMGTTYSASHVDKAYAHIDGGTSNPGYFTAPPEAYAVYTSSNTTLKFYYDSKRSSRTGVVYDIPTNPEDYPAWVYDYYRTLTRVEFDASFADARPVTTHGWFLLCNNLVTITGIEYLNTSRVTNMSFMFYYCGLPSIDVSHFNTDQVTTMSYMFSGCNALTSLDVSNFNIDKVADLSLMFAFSGNLTKIYADSDWGKKVDANASANMFYHCYSLVGSMGTAYNESHTDATYAHIDGGSSNPGYFTSKSLRGDLNGDGRVNITDVTLLITCVMLEDYSAVNAAAADVNGDGIVNVSDVTTLINVVMTAY